MPNTSGLSALRLAPLQVPANLETPLTLGLSLTGLQQHERHQKFHDFQFPPFVHPLHWSVSQHSRDTTLSCKHHQQNSRLSSPVNPGVFSLAPKIPSDPNEKLVACQGVPREHLPQRDCFYARQWLTFAFLRPPHAVQLAGATTRPRSLFNDASWQGKLMQSELMPVKVVASLAVLDWQDIQSPCPNAYRNLAQLDRVAAW